MLRLLTCGCLAVLLAATVQAQTQDPNAPAAGSSGGTPGSWVEGAIARHSAIIAQWLHGATNGQSSSQNSATGSAAAATGTNTADTGLSNLFGITTPSGGSTSTSLSNLISGLSSMGIDTSALTGSTTGTATGSSTGTTTGTTSDSTGSLSGLLAGLTGAGTQSGSGTVTPGTTGGYTATVATGQKQPSFKVRLEESLIQTFLSALTADLQHPNLVDVLVNALRPLMYPPSTGLNAAATTSGAGSASQ